MVNHEQPVTRNPQRPVIKDATRIKILLLGDTGVGKSCFVRRGVDKEFNSEYNATIGADFAVKEMIRPGGNPSRLNIWDVSGSPEFFDVRSEFYKETHGIVLMFDVTSRKSYESMDAWIKEANKCLPGTNFFVTVVGNKTDRPGRMVSERQARDWAKALGHKYFEVSCATGTGVSEVYQHVHDILTQNMK